MTELSAARKAFLSAFPAQYRDHIIAFAKGISTLDVDVIILTARKAVCLFHCLEYLGLFDPGKRLVISERWMDHDHSWLVGKKVAIVDEVIVTGTTIYKLYHDLMQIGVAKAEVHCLFVNGTYFVDDFFKNIDLSRNYIKLKGEEAQALSTAIVDAMYTIPRPYSVDYPMSTWTDILKSHLPRLQALPGWLSVTRHWMGPNRIDDRRSVAYFRITPREEIAAEIDQAIGANIFKRCIIKIRLYGYFSGSGNAKKYVFRIVPYVVLGELTLPDFEHVFAQLISQLSLSDQEIAMASCVTEDSRLRLIQYVLSGRLAQYWVSQLGAMKMAIIFRQDSSELNYIFPSSLHEIIEKLTREVRQPSLQIHWPNEKVILNQSVPAEKNQHESSPKYFRLSEPFLEMYRTKELKVRKLAIDMGEQIFHMAQYKGLLDRLNDGISVDSLRDFAKKQGISTSPSILSDFLDLSIDSGVVVPITVCSTVNGTKHLYRAYRHGEETYIIDRDLAMFHAMIDKFSKEWRPGGEATDGSLVQVPRVVVEKLLVLFMRYTIGSGLLRTNYERLDVDDLSGTLLNVGYHRHGARLSTGQHDPTEFPQDRAFVSFLVKEKVLCRVRSGGYAIQKFSRPNVLDTKRRSAATKFGGVMAKVLSLPPGQLLAPPRDTNTPSRDSPSAIRNRILVSLTTCETAASTLVAVGAELRLFCEYFSSGFALPVGDQSAALVKLQSVNARFFLNNAMAKINSHLDRVAVTAADLLRDALGEDSLEAAVWSEIWEAAVQHKSVDEEREANKHLLRSLRIVWQLDFNIQLLVLGLKTVQDEPTTSVREKLERIIQKLEHRANELASRAALSKHNATAMKAFSKMASDLHGRLKTTLSKWERLKDQRAGSPRAIAEELDRQRSEAASLFAQIDNRYRERNRISEVERFECALILRVNQQRVNYGTEYQSQWGILEQGLVRELQGYATRANGQNKPRIYRGDSSAVGTENLIQVRIIRTDTYFEVRMFGRGPGVPSWFGYIVGKFLGYDNYEAISARPSWISILGLDETRQYSHASDTDDIVGTPLVNQLISDELLTGVYEGRLITAGGIETRQAVCEAFQEEYAAVRKSQGAVRLAEPNIGIDALGGTATVCTYGADRLPPAHRRPPETEAKPAILILATEWSSHHGGLSTFNRMLCKAFGELGVKVACAVLEATPSDFEDALRNKVQLIVSPADPGIPPISGLLRAIRLPLGFNPTVVIGHGRVTGSAAKAQVADRFQEAQRIHFIHMAPGEIEWFKPNEDATKRAEEREDIERSLSMGASLVAAVGERLHGEAKSFLAGSETQVHMFEPGLMELTDAAPLKLDHCLLLGRAEDLELKGADIAAQAIGRLIKEQSLPEREIELVVRGAVTGTGGMLREKLLTFCLGADVQIRVKEFKAGDDAVERDLKRASVLLMPSRREGFGLVALEAISAGVPILVTDKSGIAAMIRRHSPATANYFIVQTVSDLERPQLIGQKR